MAHLHDNAAAFANTPATSNASLRFTVSEMAVTNNRGGDMGGGHDTVFDDQAHSNSAAVSNGSYGANGSAYSNAAANVQGPQHHPQLPDAIWVLDPLTRKLRVPTHLIVPTAATATLGTTPSLCLAFLEHRCRHPWCRQAHIPLAVVQRLRLDAQCAPTCCTMHHAPNDITFLTNRFTVIEVAFPSGAKVTVDAKRLAVTVGLQRHLAQVVPPTKKGPVLEVSSRMVCRLHLNHRCRYLEDCNNLHVCREHEEIGRSFTEGSANGSERMTPAAGATPVPMDNSPLQAVTAGNSPLPPTYDQAVTSHPGGSSTRSPPFSAPLPPPMVSPPTAGSAMTVTNATSITMLNPGCTQVTLNGRVYSVTVLRDKPVSDSEFQLLAEAQSTLFGSRHVETLDLTRTTPKFGPTAISLGSSLTALPPAAHDSHSHSGTSSSNITPQKNQPPIAGRAPTSTGSSNSTTAWGAASSAPSSVQGSPMTRSGTFAFSEGGVQSPDQRSIAPHASH